MDTWGLDDILIERIMQLIEVKEEFIIETEYKQAEMNWIPMIRKLIILGK